MLVRRQLGWLGTSKSWEAEKRQIGLLLSSEVKLQVGGMVSSYRRRLGYRFREGGRGWG